MADLKGLIQHIDEKCYGHYKNDMSVEEIAKEMDITELRAMQSITREKAKEIKNNMNNLNIKLLSDNATVPTRAYGVSAGLDIYAAETVVIEPQEKILLATDIAVDIPEGYVGLLTSRSGVSSKTHLVVETGKIDAGYNGHVKVNIKNDEQRLDWQTIMNNDELERNYEQPLVYDIKNKKIKNGNPFEVGNGRKYQINKGDKISQLVIVPIVTPEVNVVEEFESESVRGKNGFGSSGY